MKQAKRILSAVLGGMLFLWTGCDFPSDPPLKTDNPVYDQTVFSIDSADGLLPLRTGNTWRYVVTSANPAAETKQNATDAMATEMMHKGRMYYLLRYVFVEKSTNTPLPAFPSLLRNTNFGLSFYRSNSRDTLSPLTHPPELLYTLPYPADAGTIWNEPRSKYTVFVAAKDTLIYGYKSNIGHRCYRYDVRYMGFLVHRIMAIPGSALLKIDTGQNIFHSVAWKVR